MFDCQRSLDRKWHDGVQWPGTSHRQGCSLHFSSKKYELTTIQGQTECYDCNTKEVPKSFPVCTIRSTPSQPIHCIVWSKSYLFTEIFGVGEDDPSTFDHSEDTDNANEIENLRKEANALKEIRSSMGSEDFPRKIFDKVFVDDINRLRGMEDMWKSRPKPSPLDYDNVCQSAGLVPSSITLRDQSPWSLSENFAVFLDSLKRLTARMAEAQQLANATSQPAILTFDKDDVDTLDFVAATANLRAIIFGIEPRSKFDVKQMAGNIIPAIATTNAMVAGLCVLQAFKVMRQDLSKARNVFLERSTARVTNSEALRPPNPDCAVCGVVSAKVSIDPSRATLEDLVQGILRKDLGYGEEFSVSNDIGVLYDPDLDDNLEKKLGDLGVKGDSFLTIIDDDEEAPRVNVSFAVSEIPIPEEDGNPVKILEKFDIPKRKKKTEPLIDGDELDATKNVNGALPLRENSANGVLGKRKIQADEEQQGVNAGISTTKRKRSLENAGEDLPAQTTKKGKITNTATTAAADDDDVLLVVDDPGDGGNNGAIVIDD